ncbi:hypothetical protein [uncultured Methylophaga sp.]|uniref:hypothetical protein n=1 Tax=uncultured Methylophaga sp. TaxID=285271 RepID=UPI00261D3DAF|nr:hypothetical protein [uncultured Methylophaga sp.]
MSNELNPRIMKYTLTVIAVAYLIVELGFNAAIISAVSNPDQAKNLEGMGRTISAFGAALITFRFLVGSRLNMKPIQAFGAAVIAGFIIFNAQKMIINHIITAATPTDVKAAQHLTLLQSSQLSGVATLSGASDFITRNEVANKSFVSLMTFTSWHTPSHLKVVRDAAPEIVEYEVRARMGERIEEAYRSYKHYVEETLPDTYEEFASNLNENEEEISTAIKANYTRFMSWWNKASQCSTNTRGKEGMTCFQNLMHEANLQLTSVFGRQMQWQEICRPTTETKAVRLNGRVTYKTIKTHTCENMKPGDFDKRLREVLGLPEKKGEPITWESFIGSDMVRIAFNEQLGIDVDNKVELDMTFNRFVTHVGEKLIESEFQRQMTMFHTPAENLDNQGKHFVESILILPVALTFSLVFSIANAVALLASIPAGGLSRKLIVSTSIIGLIVVCITAPNNGVIDGVSGWLLDGVVQLEQMVYPLGSHFSFIFK